MEHKCANCGKTYDPDAYQFYMYGFGPECVKKFLSGELNYPDLVREGSSPFGITDEVVKRWLPDQVNKEMELLLKSEQWSVFRGTDEGLPDELLKEYMLGASPISTAIIAGRVANMRAFVTTQMKGFVENNDEEGIGMVNSFLSQLDGIESAIIEPDGTYNNAIPMNRTDYNYQFNRNMYNVLLGEPTLKQKQGDYALKAFDTSSRYAFQLAKVGCAPEGVKSGIHGMIMSSAFDALTDPKGENEFFRVSSYMNAESFSERTRSFPNSAIMRDILITDAILATSTTKSEQDNAEILLPLKKFLTDDQIARIIKSEVPLVNLVKKEDYTLFGERKNLVPGFESPAQYIVAGELVEMQRRIKTEEEIPRASVGQAWYALPWTNTVRGPSKVRLNDFRRGLTVFDYHYDHAHSSFLARNELKRVLSGEKKMNMNSLAPLALAVSALANKDTGYFANVIRVKDGVIDKVFPATSKEVVKNEGIFTASMRAHAALKATVWKNDDFFKESKDKGYEYFVATTGHNAAGGEYRTSFHVKPKQMDAKSAFDDAYNVTESGRRFPGVQMTQVWSLNSDVDDTHGSRDASWYKFANQDTPRIPKSKLQESDQELIDKSKFIKNIVKKTAKEQSDITVNDAYLAGVNGMLGQCGASFASQIKRARAELPVTSEAMELLKDSEISVAGYSAAGLNFDPASIMVSGDIVSDRIPENPVIHESHDPSPIAATLSKIFKS